MPRNPTRKKKVFSSSYLPSSLFWAKMNSREQKPRSFLFNAPVRRALHGLYKTSIKKKGGKSLGFLSCSKSRNDLKVLIKHSGSLRGDGRNLMAFRKSSHSLRHALAVTHLKFSITFIVRLLSRFGWSGTFIKRKETYIMHTERRVNPTMGLFGGACSSRDNPQFDV